MPTAPTAPSMHAEAMRRIERRCDAIAPLVIAERDRPSMHDLVLMETGLPDWWQGNGNALFAPPGSATPHLLAHPGLPPPSNALIAIGHATLPPSLRLWGDGALIWIGDRVSFPGCHFACAGQSTIVMGDGTQCTGSSEINCRNGGLIVIGGDGLWAANVRVVSDDMHAIRNLSDGARCNAFGGVVAVAGHVWLGYESILLPGAGIGRDSVVGARSVVTTILPANTVNVGIPARTVRSGTTWTHEDAP